MKKGKTAEAKTLTKENVDLLDQEEAIDFSTLTKEQLLMLRDSQIRLAWIQEQHMELSKTYSTTYKEDNKGNPTSCNLMDHLALSLRGRIVNLGFLPKAYGELYRVFDEKWFTKAKVIEMFPFSYSKILPEFEQLIAEGFIAIDESQAKRQYQLGNLLFLTQSLPKLQRMHEMKSAQCRRNYEALLNEVKEVELYEFTVAEYQITVRDTLLNNAKGDVEDGQESDTTQ